MCLAMGWQPAQGAPRFLSKVTWWECRLRKALSWDSNPGPLHSQVKMLNTNPRWGRIMNILMNTSLKHNMTVTSFLERHNWHTALVLDAASMCKYRACKYTSWIVQYVEKSHRGTSLCLDTVGFWPLECVELKKTESYAGIFSFLSPFYFIGDFNLSKTQTLTQFTKSTQADRIWEDWSIWGFFCFIFLIAVRRF